MVKLTAQQQHEQQWWQGVNSKGHAPTLWRNGAASVQEKRNQIVKTAGPSSDTLASGFSLPSLTSIRPLPPGPSSCRKKQTLL